MGPFVSDSFCLRTAILYHGGNHTRKEAFFFAFSVISIIASWQEVFAKRFMTTSLSWIKVACTYLPSSSIPAGVVTVRTKIGQTVSSFMKNNNKNYKDGQARSNMISQYVSSYKIKNYFN